MKIVPIILCGGQSRRLWPLTGENKPKQFLKLPNGNSLFEETLSRAKSVAELSSAQPEMGFATNLELLDKTSKQIDTYLPKKFIQTILAEPSSKDTAASVSLMAQHYDEKDLILLILPSDHIVKDADKFLTAVKAAIRFAEKDDLTLVGIKPNHPSSAYGYLKTKNDDVISFHEKPDKKTAFDYYCSGDYYWNSGIICCRASVLSSLIEEYCFSLSSQSKSILANIATEKIGQKTVLKPIQNEFEKLEKRSIDHLLLENIRKAKFVHSEMSWRDLGSWNSYSQLFDRDLLGNSTSLNGFAEEGKNCSVFAHEKPVATLGLSNIIVVDSEDGVLVADKASVQNVKKVYERIQSNKSLTQNERQGYVEIPPWGKFEILSNSENYKVKKLSIDPVQSLSLQSHQHRDEHWVVVQGVADISVNHERLKLSCNDHIKVPKGAKHRISNPGKTELILIETQLGSDLSEEDQVRYEDDYGRKCIV